MEQEDPDRDFRARLGSLWKHPCVSAESFLTNLQTFLSLLLTSKSSKVAEWKIEHCKNAFAWAKYFEDVRASGLPIARLTIL